nr:protein transport protein SEC31-like [Aegilops tauschii subsp. strangulata]
MASVLAGRSVTSPSPTGLRLARPRRMGSWRGPLPPRRMTPAPVFSQFLERANMIPASSGPAASPMMSICPGSMDADADVPETRSQPIQMRAASDPGPMQRELGQVFSWAYLRCRMRVLWEGFPTSIAPTSIAEVASHSPPLPPDQPGVTGAARSYAVVTAAPLRPMAGAPPPSTRGAGAPVPHGPLVAGETASLARPQAPTQGFTSPPPMQQQRGPAPPYIHGGSQPYAYAHPGQYNSPYGPAVAGGSVPMYGAPPPPGVTAPPQFHPRGAVA